MRATSEFVDVRHSVPEVCNEACTPQVRAWCSSAAVSKWLCIADCKCSNAAASRLRQTDGVSAVHTLRTLSLNDASDMLKSRAHRCACLGCKALCAEVEIGQMLTVQREGQRAALTPHVPLKSTAVALGQTQEVLLG